MILCLTKIKHSMTWLLQCNHENIHVFKILLYKQFNAITSIWNIQNKNHITLSADLEQIVYSWTFEHKFCD